MKTSTRNKSANLTKKTRQTCKKKANMHSKKKRKNLRRSKLKKPTCVQHAFKEPGNEEQNVRKMTHASLI